MFDENGFANSRGMPMAELAGTWTLRSFNPTLADQTASPRERALVRADAVLNLRNAAEPPYLQGTIEWPVPNPTEGLDLNGTVEGENFNSVNLVGIGRRDTAGWEYWYYGRLAPRWENAVDQRPYLVGSVIRVNPHNGKQGGGWESPAGEVFSFIAVKQQPPVTWELSGSWTYRSFLNEHRPIYETASPTANGLILQEAVLRLETPTDRTVRGAIEWPGRSLDVQGTIYGFPSIFQITGTGGGWEYRYQGFLTTDWERGVNQRPALVGSVIHVLPPPGGYVTPFIAVKQ
jgi:hypothetical protein